MGAGGIMTMDPTIKPELVQDAAEDAKVLQNLGRMKEFDVQKWVNESYIRKTYAELGLDYEKQRASFDNYEVKGEDKFCKAPIGEPRKPGDAEPIEISPVAASQIAPPEVPAAQPRAAQLIALAGRWLALNRGRLRALALGALALLLFLVAWHLLTKYRVNIYVRFLNVPSPEQVLERAVRAFNDPRFFSHVVLS